MSNKLTYLKKTAFHEAGHAVARHFLHLPFRYVTIKPGEDSLGHVLSFPLPDSFRPDLEESTRIRIRAEKHITVYFAGHAAEANIAGRRNWSGASQDTRNATELALHLCGSEKQTGAFLDWMWLRTIDWIKQPLHWIAVEAVAEELLRSKLLRAKEVKTIIYKAIESKMGIKLNMNQ